MSSLLYRRIRGAITLCLVWMVLPGLSNRAAAQEYTQTNLVSDIAGMAAWTDPNLKNPWGMSFFPGSPFWVSDFATGVTTLYSGQSTPPGMPASLVVNIPPPKGSSGPSLPTGQVANATSDFQVTPGNSGLFIFATFTGTISAWNPSFDPQNAKLMVDHSRAGAIYTGLAMASHNGANFLYVANLHSGKIEVYDGKFRQVALHFSAFKDEQIPGGYAPFNVENIGGLLYVAYAKQNPGRTFVDFGAGLGFVDVYTADGALIQRLQGGWWLNAPWGVALAPASFGLFGGDILVGQFGSGWIAAFEPLSGQFDGFLLDIDDNPITNDGLWAIHFGGGGAKGGDPGTLYFTSGPNAGVDGLFGSLSPADGP